MAALDPAHSISEAGSGMGSPQDFAEMRSQGKVVSWQDDRGFGFIVPEPAGERIFVHIRSFASWNRRPVVGDCVTLATRLDKQRRPQAVEVRLVGSASPGLRASVSQLAATLLALGFLGLIAVLCGLDRVKLEVLGLYFIASAVTFFAYALDKSAARGGRWRTPESTLQGLALMGGWPGALLAQHWLRHKSSKPRFLALFWLLVVVNVVLLLAAHQ